MGINTMIMTKLFNYILSFFDSMIIGYYLTLKNTVYYPGDKSYFGLGAKEHSLFLSAFAHIFMSIALLNLIVQKFNVELPYKTYFDYLIATIVFVIFYYVYIWKDRLDKTLSRKLSKNKALHIVVSLLYFILSFWLFIVI